MLMHLAAFHHVCFIDLVVLCFHVTLESKDWKQHKDSKALYVLSVKFHDGSDLLSLKEGVHVS